MEIIHTWSENEHKHYRLVQFKNGRVAIEYNYGWSEWYTTNTGPSIASEMFKLFKETKRHVEIKTEESRIPHRFHAKRRT